MPDGFPLLHIPTHMHGIAWIERSSTHKPWTPPIGLIPSVWGGASLPFTCKASSLHHYSVISRLSLMLFSNL